MRAAPLAAAQDEGAEDAGAAAQSLAAALCSGDARTLRTLAREGPIALLPLEDLVQAFLYTPFRADLARNPGLTKALRTAIAEWLRTELAAGRMATFAADLVECLADACRPLPPAVIVPAIRIALSRPRTFGIDARQRLARASLRYPRDLTGRHLELIYDALGRDVSDARLILEHPCANECPGLLRRAADDWKDSRDLLEIIAGNPAARRDPYLLETLLTHRDIHVIRVLAANSEPGECRAFYDRFIRRGQPIAALGVISAMSDEAWTRFTAVDLLPFLRHADGRVRVYAQTLVCKLVPPAADEPGSVRLPRRPAGGGNPVRANEMR